MRTSAASGTGYDNGANINILSRASGVNIWGSNSNSPTNAGDNGTSSASPSVSGTTANNGSGSAHSHTLNNMNLKFVDLIVAQKD